MSELIRLENIRKTFAMGPDRVEVLKGVNLSVEEGEFVAIMGASGSGKSTLLHLAGALERQAVAQGERGGAAAAWLGLSRDPYRYDSELAGEIFFRGQAISRMTRRQRHRMRNREFGFVFQFYHLLPELTVVENVLLPAMVAAPAYLAFLGARPRREAALELLEAFGLSGRLKHRPAQLSGGERQRVAIARALINQPALLLADEPTGNLDAKMGRAILDVLVNLNKNRGQSILMVTHDAAIAALADRTVHLVEGRIREN